MSGPDTSRVTSPVIFRAARVITMSQSRGDAFAVADGRITAVGSLSDVRARFAGVDVVDLGDVVVVPGLSDAHTHLGIGSEQMLQLDLSPAAIATTDQAVAAIRDEAKTVAAGRWVRAAGYDDVKTAGPVLDRWQLDAAAPNTPVLALHVAGHWGVVNSAALALGGLGDDAVDPAGGVLGRDETGRLNGVLHEQALFDFVYPAATRRDQVVVPPYGFDDRRRGMSRAIERMHAGGLTSICDALIGPDELDLFDALASRDELTLRISYLLAAEHWGSPAAQRIGPARMIGVKTFVDGAIGGRTCLLEHPYEGSDSFHGIQSRSTDELRDVIRSVHAANVPVGVHANGDRAISLLLDIFEEQPRPDLRNRIEHCSVVTDDILRRMRQLQLTAVPFGSYVQYHGKGLVEWYGEERVSRMFAHRSFLDAGVHVAGSSDWPCGPMEPLLGLRSCITRRGADGAEIGINQRVTSREALALYTTAAARARGAEADEGRLDVGCLADFTVLSDYQLDTIDFEWLDAVSVVATYVGGRRVWPR